MGTYETNLINSKMQALDGVKSEKQASLLKKTDHQFRFLTATLSYLHYASILQSTPPLTDVDIHSTIATHIETTSQYIFDFIPVKQTTISNFFADSNSKVMGRVDISSSRLKPPSGAYLKTLELNE